MALPNYRLSIFKKLDAEEWSNDWMLYTGSFAEATAVAEALINFERNVHGSRVDFTYYLLSSTTVGDRLFKHVGINQAGLRGINTGLALPLFNTVRLDLSTNLSDPCRKYFRCPLEEGNQTDGQLESAFLTMMQTQLVDHFFNSVAMDNVVSGKGNVVTGGSWHPYVQMRQLHRRKKKKVT